MADRNEILDLVTAGMKAAGHRMTLRDGSKCLYRQFELLPGPAGSYQVIHWGDRIEVGLCFDSDPILNHRESEKFKQMFSDEIDSGEVRVHAPTKKNVYLIRTVPIAGRNASDIADEAVKWMLWFMERCEEEDLIEL